jgi:hypothetical protein
MSYYETVVSPAVQHAWDRLPKEKLATAAKVIGAAAVLLGLYNMYRSIRSLQDRVQQLENKPDAKKPNPIESLQNRVQQLETDLAAEKQKSQQTEHKCNELKRRIDELDDVFESCDSDDDDIVFSQPPVTNPASTTTSVASLSGSEGTSTTTPINTATPAAVASPTKTALQLFCEKFPGSDLQCMVGSEQTTFAKYFLHNFLGIDNTTKCEPDGNGWYTLTFQREPKEIIFNQLPHKDDQSLFEKGLRAAFSGLAKIIKIKFQLSNVVRLQIVKYKDATKIEFDPTAFSMCQGWSRWLYTAHLKSIAIFNAPLENGYRFLLEGEHNSSLTSEKSGFMDDQKFVELLELNK